MSRLAETAGSLVRLQCWYLEHQSVQQKCVSSRRVCDQIAIRVLHLSLPELTPTQYADKFHKSGIDITNVHSLKHWMYRVKQLLGGQLSLRNYNAQVGETYAMIKALNKLTGLGMPETYSLD